MTDHFLFGVVILRRLLCQTNIPDTTFQGVPSEACGQMIRQDESYGFLKWPNCTLVSKFWQYAVTKYKIVLATNCVLEQ